MSAAVLAACAAVSVAPAAHADRAEPPPLYGYYNVFIEGAGCPGEGPGTHWLPISLTPIDPPQPR
ncbi:hypothetical protein [Mycolicibacterium holsaticum]|uniref:hypothetical protein n=1 Tax=Mycolicibacterium holsaticum TaxID=152142 RepID=UPI003B8A61AE